MPSSVQTIDDSSVEHLLRSMENHEQAADPVREFIGKADHFWNADRPRAQEQLPRQLGRYRLLELLGEGGFGLVYLAEDTPSGKRVALKLPRPERYLRPEWRERFLRESRAAAVLTHENIVRVYDSGEIDGQWYISTSYCPGPNLAQWLAAHQNAVEVTVAAQLLSTLAGAMAHAHARGVIHRDLKPSNILLQPKEGASSTSLAEFTPCIADFGLAKLIEESGIQTGSGVLLGTLQYMAPEQAGMKHQEMGPATDIYALGLILYEVLTRRPVVPAEPLLLSLPKILHDSAPRLRSARPDCPVDLETIYLKCLEKNPRQRYASAQALHDDLNRFLQGQSIVARPVSMVRRLSSWVKREPVFATILLFSLLTMMLIVAGVLFHSHQTDQANQRIRVALHHTQQLHYLSTIQRAAQLVQSGDGAEASQLLNRCREELEEQQSPLTWEWRYLWNRVQRMPRHYRWLGHHATPYALAYSPVRHMLATCDSLGVLMIRHPDTGKILHTLQSPKPKCPTLAFSSDGRWLAQLCGEDHPNINTALVWDTDDWSIRHSIHVEEELSSLCFHPQEPVLLLTTRCNIPGQDKGRVLRWRYLDTQAKPEAVISNSRCQTIWWNQKLKSFVVALNDNFILLDEQFKLWQFSPGPGDEIQAAATSPNALWFAWGNRKGVINLFDLRHSNLKPSHSWSSYSDWIYHLDFSPSSKLLASCGRKQRVQLWDVETGKLAYELPNKGNTHEVIFAPDEKSVFFTSSDDFAVNRWYFAETSQKVSQASFDDQVWCLALAPDGKTLYAGLDDKHSKATIRQLDPGKPEWSVLGKHSIHGACVIGIVPLEQEGRVISASMDGVLALLDLKTNTTLTKVTTHQERGIRQLIELEPGKAVATCGHDGLIRLWNQALQPLGEPLNAHDKQPVRDLCYDRRRHQFYSAGNDGRIVQWDVATQKMVRALEADAEVRSLCLSHDGQYLAYGTKLGDIYLVSLSDWKVIRQFRAHEEPVTDILFSPDDRTLVSGDFVGHLYLWNVESGEQVLKLPDHQNRISTLLWSKDGSRLYSASLDGRIVEHDFR